MWPSYTLDLVRPGCAWREELYACNPVLCFQWSFTHHGAPQMAQGDLRASRSGCQSVACGALFEMSRGEDQIIDFEEAVAFDDAARDRVNAAGSACEWPAKLQRGDSCWRTASDSSQKELVQSDACTVQYIVLEIGTVRAVSLFSNIGQEINP